MSPTRQHFRGHCCLDDRAAPEFERCGQSHQVTRGFPSPSRRASAILRHRTPPCCHWLQENKNKHRSKADIKSDAMKTHLPVRVRKEDRQLLTLSICFPANHTSKISHFGTSMLELELLIGSNVGLLQ